MYIYLHTYIPTDILPSNPITVGHSNPLQRTITTSNFQPPHLFNNNISSIHHGILLLLRARAQSQHHIPPLPCLNLPQDQTNHHAKPNPLPPHRYLRLRNQSPHLHRQRVLPGTLSPSRTTHSCGIGCGDSFCGEGLGKWLSWLRSWSCGVC